MVSYVTICTNAAYTTGVLLLKNSLDKVKAKYPLLLVCPDIYPVNCINILEKNGIKTKMIENQFILKNMDIIKINGKKYKHWNETFFKLSIFGLTEYKKIVFLDSDMIVLENIDELFNMSHMTACAAGQLSFPDYIQLNSGLMVIEPSIDILHKARSLFAKPPRLFYGDQDVIHELYPEWPNRKELHLSEHYNLFYGLAAHYSKYYGYNFTGFMNKDNNIKIIHYIGAHKPWMKIPLNLKIRKILSKIKRMVIKKPLVVAKLDEYYKKLSDEIKLPFSNFSDE